MRLMSNVNSVSVTSARKIKWPIFLKRLKLEKLAVLLSKLPSLTHQLVLRMRIYSLTVLHIIRGDAGRLADRGGFK